jgi:hypothetical protein
VVQWDREPELDQDGNVVGFKDTMRITPSHLLTKDQAAQVRSVTTKSGSLKFEAFDKLAALTQLAKILGMNQDPQTQSVSNATVNVQHVNIGGDNALEAVRRLAFAIAKAQHTQSLLPQRGPSATQYAALVIRKPNGSRDARRGSEPWLPGPYPLRLILRAALAVDAPKVQSFQPCQGPLSWPPSKSWARCAHGGCY